MVSSGGRRKQNGIVWGAAEKTVSWGRRRKITVSWGRRRFRKPLKVWFFRCKRGEARNFKVEPWAGFRFLIVKALQKTSAGGPCNNGWFAPSLRNTCLNRNENWTKPAIFHWCHPNGFNFWSLPPQRKRYLQNQSGSQWKTKHTIVWQIKWGTFRLKRSCGQCRRPQIFHGY